MDGSYLPSLKIELKAFDQIAELAGLARRLRNRQKDEDPNTIEMRETAPGVYVPAAPRRPRRQISETLDAADRVIDEFGKLEEVIDRFYYADDED